MKRPCLTLAAGWLVCCMVCPVWAEDVEAARATATGKRSVDLAGDWRLLLPAGFEYPVKLVPHRDGYRLETHGIATGGPYAVRGEKLVFVGTDERQRFEWKILSRYMLALGEHDAANGADYTGAVLFRQSPAAALKLSHEAPAKAAVKPSAPRRAKSPAALPAVSVEELEALVKSGDYTDVRNMMMGRELQSIAVVDRASSDGKYLQVNLSSGSFWSASLFGWQNYEELQPGDRIEFRGRMMDECYANIAVWVDQFKKLPKEPPQNKPHEQAGGDDTKADAKADANAIKLGVGKRQRKSLASLLDRPSKVAGSALGFATLEDALDYWSNLEPGERWTGELATSLPWNQIERIRVLQLAMHLRTKADMDEFLKPALASAVLVQPKPDKFPQQPKSGHDGVMLQCLLELEGGESALVTIGNTHPNWLVAEYQGRVGLAMLK